jgi:hypothetical protein
MAGEYEVGFGRPPKRTRWEKRQCGNPARRKARRAATTAEIIDKLLLAPITIEEKDIATRGTVMEAITLQLWKKAVDGHARAVDVLLKYQELGHQRPQIATEIAFGDNPYNQNADTAPSSDIDGNDGRV